MLESLKRLDVRGWWKWLSSIGVGLLFLLLAALRQDYSFAVMAIGVIITGLADYVDRRNRRRWWALLGMGTVLTVAGIYLEIKNYPLSDFFFHNVFKP
jgi:uncharacterized membrane protein HdeD (DUF308 family)